MLIKMGAKKDIRRKIVLKKCIGGGLHSLHWWALHSAGVLPPGPEYFLMKIQANWFSGITG